MDIRTTRTLELIKCLAGDISLHFYISVPVPMPPLVFQINVQHPVLYLRHHSVANFRIVGTDRHRFLTTLAQKEFYAAADLDPMEIPDRTLLRIGIIDNFRILRQDNHPGQ